MLKTNVLDKGFIHTVDALGTDLSVVNSARVSFGKQTDTLRPKDVKLIDYLARNKHHSPFRHCLIQFHVKAPEFVMRQWYKHVVGAETTSNYATKDHAWNEISGRYVEMREFYKPDVWRRQSEDNKQASDGELSDVQQAFCSSIYEHTLDTVLACYRTMLDEGVAREQARMILPLNMYTEVYWTASLQAVANFVMLRDHDHAQREIREYAAAMHRMAEDLFPIAFPAILNSLK